MSTVNLHPTPPTLPAGYCIGAGLAGLQEFVNTIIGNTLVPLAFDTNTFFNFGASVPSASNRDYPWLRWSASDPWMNGWFVFQTGYWLKAHHLLAGGDDVRIWKGDPADIDDYDGGEAAAGGDPTYSGPMWEIDTDFNAKMPIGVGTLPVAGTVLAVGDTGGADQITLAVANFVHKHVFGKYYNPTNDDAQFLVGDSTGITQQNSMQVHGDTGSADEANITSGDLVTADPVLGTPTALTTISPYRAVYFIKRTARVYYRLGP